MTTQELNYIKTTISWLLENGDFKDSETSYNTAMNSINTLEEAISVTCCCEEFFCEDEDLGHQTEKCAKQCDACSWIEKRVAK
jgi:hypothetical protein